MCSTWTLYKVQLFDIVIIEKVVNMYRGEPVLKRGILIF